MATLVDAIGVFKNIGLYDTVFPAILIFAVVYGLLSKLEPFGENKAVNGIVAIIIALFFISFMKAVTFISYLIPLFTAFFVIILLVMLVFMFMGVPSETIKEAMTSSSGYGVMIILFVLFVFIVLSVTFPPTEEVPPGETDVFAQTAETLFSPVIMGIITLLAIFAVATYYITREKKS
ncbi:hypothetical protein GF374_02415 [Candidatus Woesearchaeota archaeon]|nr:hypothetical protein [Candidatus Woesearchaeota archaeon]